MSSEAQVSESKALGSDGLPRKRGRRPVRGVASGLQLNLNSGAARHAAEQYKTWVQALGGADSVTPQEATLLRHASYLATLADALWYGVCTSAQQTFGSADALAKAAGACSNLLRACGLARRASDAGALAPRLRDLHQQLAAPLAARSPAGAPLAGPAGPSAPTPGTLRPPHASRVERTPGAETLALLSDATARSAALPGAPLAFYADAGEQPALPGLEAPSEAAKRKQYLWSSDSEQARRLRTQRASTAGLTGAQARWGKPETA
jgi:hypothetical protein